LKHRQGDEDREQDQQNRTAKFRNELVQKEHRRQEQAGKNEQQAADPSRLPGRARRIVPKGRVLLLETEISENARLASRNLDGIDLVDANALNALSLAAYSKILITRKALDRLVERLNGGSSK
jgi:ribosomal protein L4